MNTPLYTVFGNPISHSKSPQIHQHFAAQEGIQIEYTRSFAENDVASFQAAVKAFFQNGGQGANITLPFKSFAYDFADCHSERAQAAGAVNTFVPQEDGSLFGDNTDGAGLIQDLRDNLNINLRDKHILILGAGGATRGVVLPLLTQQVASITIANRTHEKAIELAKSFDVHALPFKQLSGNYNIIINATSGSLNNAIPDIPASVFSGSLLAYDMFYANQTTTFMNFAQQNGATQTADGLGMLVGQAAASYFQWRGFMPQTAPVIAAIRTEMTA
ncbi:MAG: shikimate dehydrogenase [Alysiella sp.]|uniref:shikimate dehydrogenase n=1 Tax=Alysiella sp. TaxID=1872483 RepID=UPI0026DA714F|nr:shikimate dehydrogenase [Alysiella sp.]MDO4434596.1 shikimate dehydrogenase [Alysiella sp.]